MTLTGHCPLTSMWSAVWSHWYTCGQKQGHVTTQPTPDTAVMVSSYDVTEPPASTSIVPLLFTFTAKSHTPSFHPPFVPMGGRNSRASPLPCQVFTTHSLLVVLLQKTMSTTFQSQLKVSLMPPVHLPQFSQLSTASTLYYQFNIC